MLVGGYLSALQRHVHAPEVVSEKLLKEVHLSNAEVKIQTAGHINLKRMATHHTVLQRNGSSNCKSIIEAEYWR